VEDDRQSERRCFIPVESSRPACRENRKLEGDLYFGDAAAMEAGDIPASSPK